MQDESALTWPKGIRNDETLEAFIAYFDSLGYVVCDESTLDEEFLKVAIFVKDDYPTHVCRQLPAGKWTSKIGYAGVDIEHDDIESISGATYGTAIAFMKRNVNYEPDSA